MKSIEIKALIALLVITITLSASVMRETKAAAKTVRKSKSKTMEYNGSGSWSAGYDCPYIEVLNAQMQVVEQTKKWSFKPTGIIGSYGFRFVMDEAVTPLFSKYVRQIKLTGEKYVPWRFFDNVKYQKKSSSFKMLVCDMRNDLGEKNTIRFNLPWKFIGSYISVGQTQDLKAKFISWADSQKNAIQAAKANTDSYFGEASAAKRALDSATTDAAALKAATEANIQKNQALLVERRAAIKAVDAQIQTARPTIMGLRASEEAISAEMQAADQQYGNNVKLIDDNQRQEEFAKVDASITAETNEVIGDITKLKVQCPNYSMDAVTTAASAGDANKVGQLLMGFQPTM